MPQHDQAPSTAVAHERRLQPASDTPSSGPANSVAAAALSADGIPRGGGAHTVVRGDTLWDIANTTYGSGALWRQIAEANRGEVFRDGELILVGTVLRLPVIRIPSEPPPDGASPSPDGGQHSALEGVCTEYGDFTIYPDSFVGPLPESEDGSRCVRRSEYAEVIAAAEARAVAQRSQVEGQVGDLLSYGAFDWAITDAEAARALTLLGGLPHSQLRTAVANIPNIGRLLEQLPASSRRSEAYARLLVALGPSRVAPYLKDLLAVGLFDWAVTDDEVRSVVAILGLLTGPQRFNALIQLSPSVYPRLLASMEGSGDSLSAGDKDLVTAIFRHTADGSLDLLTSAFEKRFALDARGTNGAAWDAAGLRRCWDVLETLPPSHIQGNPSLLQWIRYGSARANHSGWYKDDRFGNQSHAAGFDYTTANIATSTQRSQSDEDGDGTDEVTDPLHGVNRFNKVVRHEVGHAVDDAMGAEALYCAGNAAGGNWTNYGSDARACIRDMITAVGGTLDGLDAAVQSAFIDAIAADADNALTAVQATPEYAALDAAVQALVDLDPVFGALAMAVDNPWYRHSGGGTPLDGRIYQRSYSSVWTAYDQAARTRKVSEYQFRAPGEWFAEAYAAYYQPNPDGSCDHHVLAGVDPTTKSWFDTHVATWAGDE